MKYLMVVLLMLSLNAVAQSHKDAIAAYRQTYKDDFLKDAHSPLKQADLQNLRFYDADSTYRVIAKAELLSNAPTFIMPVFSGTGREYVRYALLKFTLQGKPMELTLYKSVSLSQNPQYSNYLFLPFTDDTNGTETYTGGRYIDMKTDDIKNGEVVLDFNKAYNPYCAFSSGYACPKPPDENRIEMKLNAGEKLFAGAVKH